MASSIQKTLRRQCGVPAFSSNPALASSGTRHCTILPNVESISRSCWCVSEIAMYTARNAAHADNSQIVLRVVDGIALSLFSVSGPDDALRSLSGGDGLMITRGR